MPSEVHQQTRRKQVGLCTENTAEESVEMEQMIPIMIRAGVLNIPFCYHPSAVRHPTSWTWRMSLPTQLQETEARLNNPYIGLMLGSRRKFFLLSYFFKLFRNDSIIFNLPYTLLKSQLLFQQTPNGSCNAKDNEKPSSCS